MVHPMGFEPMTPRLKVWCYFQLSYGCKLFVRLSHAFSLHIFYFLSYLVYILYHFFYKKSKKIFRWRQC